MAIDSYEFADRNTHMKKKRKNIEKFAARKKFNYNIGFESNQSISKGCLKLENKLVHR